MIEYPIYKLKDVSMIIAGQSPESKYYNTVGDGLPFFQGKADFGDLYPTIRTYCSQPTKIAEKDDILLSVRAPVGPTNLSPGKVCIGRGLSAIRPGEKLDLRYLLYYFRQYEAYLREKGTGTTFKAITQDILKNLEIPVPPLEEQKRIVARIEELFSELDAAVATLERTKEQLAVYRQAVLKEAFASLSATETLKSQTSLITSGSRGWAKYYSETGVQFLRIGNLTHSGIEISFDDVQHLTLPESIEGKRSRLIPNDILISITANLGSIGLVPETIPESYINQHIALVRLKSPEMGRFIAWYLRSEIGQKDLLKNKRGAGKLGLGLDDIRETKIPVVVGDSANLIVSEIESRLSVCDKIEETVTTALHEAEAMRQSILRQAFAGELQS